MNPNRTYFRYHAVIEWRRAGSPIKCIDVCHAILQGGGGIAISDGSQDLGAYYAAAVNNGYYIAAIDVRKWRYG
jgi:hypothetical protein